MSRAAQRAALAAAVVLVALGAAWLVPALAIPVVWPLLFLVPGWGLVALAAGANGPGARIPATGRLGLAIIVSVAVSTHLVWWLSLPFGYHRGTVFVAAVILAAPLLVAAWRGDRTAGIAPAVRGAWRAVRRDPTPFLLAIVAASFVGTVLATGLWVVTGAGVDSGGSNWSDLGVHLSIAQSVNAGNFPPQVPYFAGVPLVYHWFADFHDAIAANAAGLFAIPVFITSSAIMAGSLILLVHGLARVLLRGAAARRAAIIAATIAVFAGGLGWIRLVGDLANGLGSPLALITQNSYDNSWYDSLGHVTWPYFRIPSVMGTGLLVHRATMVGLPMLVAVVLLLVAGLPTARQRARGWRDRPLLIGLAGLTGGLLAPFHFFFFPAGLLLGLVWVLSARRLTDGAAPRNALLFLAPYLLSLPFVFAPLAQASGSGALHLVAGWESAPFADGPWAVAFFYATNLGIPLLLAIGAILAPRTPVRWFLAAWVVLVFLIPNVVQVSVIAFDMNKYFQAMWIAVALLAAWLVRRWPWPAVAVVLALSVPSPLLVGAWTALNREQVLSADELAAAEWIAANTPDRSVFVTDGWLNSPTDPAGRLRLLTYQPYVANLGYATAARAEDVTTIYCGGDVGTSVSLMQALGAEYLIDGSRPSPCPNPVQFQGTPQFTQVYANTTVTIYRLTADGATGTVSSGP